jgi:hypothetical protein
MTNPAHPDALRALKDVPRQMTADREHGYDHLVWLSDVEKVLAAVLDGPRQLAEKPWECPDCDHVCPAPEPPT